MKLLAITKPVVVVDTWVTEENIRMIVVNIRLLAITKPVVEVNKSVIVKK